MAMDDVALWMAQPHFNFLEMAHLAGYRNLIVELEHGSFDLSTLDQFLALARAKGMRTIAKVVAPTAEAIQQALDFGADGVVIPHLLDVAHARAVTAAAKYPMLGTRSFAGGRVFGYGRPDSDALAAENRRTRCFALIETAESLADVEAIAALDTVDGLFPGPTDLALARGRGAYAFTPADRDDLARCARAARAAGKPWIMPAWTPAERAFAREEGAALMVVATQTMTIRQGMAATIAALGTEGILA
ncbi:5-keto-4-deoxy-D-glucarate aldolase [bacterium YEK0313]|nr:5-keto-4-deoxy-D-glucarate aldolase [bacterium YEK0313]